MMKAFASVLSFTRPPVRSWSQTLCGRKYPENLGITPTLAPTVNPTPTFSFGCEKFSRKPQDYYVAVSPPNLSLTT